MLESLLNFQKDACSIYRIPSECYHFGHHFPEAITKKSRQVFWEQKWRLLTGYTIKWASWADKIMDQKSNQSQTLTVYCLEVNIF